MAKQFYSLVSRDWISLEAIINDLSSRIITGFQAQGDVLDDLNTLGVNSADGEMIVGTGAGALAWESGATLRTSIGVYSTAEVDAAITAAVTAEDLDFAGDSGTGAVDLDSETLTLATSNDSLVTSAASQTLTISLADVLEDLDTLGPPTLDGQFLVADGAGSFVYESGATARTSLGLSIGTDVQAFDAVLEDLSALTAVSGADQLIVSTGAGVYAHEAASTLPATIGGVIQDLDTLGANSADSEFLVGTGAGALAWESGSTARTSLGLGNVENTALSTWAGSANLTTVGTLTNLTTSDTSVTFSGEFVALNLTADNNFTFSTNSVERLSLTSTSATFNSGQNDVNFIINTDNETSKFYVDGGTDSVAIGNSGPVNAQGQSLQIGTFMMCQEVVSSQLMFAQNAFFDGAWKKIATAKSQAIRMNAIASDSISFHLNASAAGGSTMSNWDSSDVKMVIRESGNVKISDENTSVEPSAKLEVVVSSATAATPVLLLDQSDISEEMIQFETTIGTGNAIEAVAAKSLTTTHFIKVTLPGALTRYIPVGTIA